MADRFTKVSLKPSGTLSDFVDDKILGKDVN
jgi:hypothetical protein